MITQITSLNCRTKNESLPEIMNYIFYFVDKQYNLWNASVLQKVIALYFSQYVFVHY